MAPVSAHHALLLDGWDLGKQASQTDSIILSIKCPVLNVAECVVLRMAPLRERMNSEGDVCFDPSASATSSDDEDRDGLLKKALASFLENLKDSGLLAWEYHEMLDEAQQMLLSNVLFKRLAEWNGKLQAYEENKLRDADIEKKVTEMRTNYIRELNLKDQNLKSLNTTGKVPDRVLSFLPHNSSEGTQTDTSGAAMQTADLFTRAVQLQKKYDTSRKVADRVLDAMKAWQCDLRELLPQLISAKKAFTRTLERVERLEDTLQEQFQSLKAYGCFREMSLMQIAEESSCLVAAIEGKTPGDVTKMETKRERADNSVLRHLRQTVDGSIVDALMEKEEVAEGDEEEEMLPIFLDAATETISGVLAAGDKLKDVYDGIENPKSFAVRIASGGRKTVSRLRSSKLTARKHSCAAFNYDDSDDDDDSGSGDASSREEHRKVPVEWQQQVNDILGALRKTVLVTEARFGGMDHRKVRTRFGGSKIRHFEASGHAGQAARAGAFSRQRSRSSAPNTSVEEAHSGEEDSLDSDGEVRSGPLKGRRSSRDEAEMTEMDEDYILLYAGLKHDGFINQGTQTHSDCRDMSAQTDTRRRALRDYVMSLPEDESDSTKCDSSTMTDKTGLVRYVMESDDIKWRNVPLGAAFGFRWGLMPYLPEDVAPEDDHLPFGAVPLQQLVSGSRTRVTPPCRSDLPQARQQALPCRVTSAKTQTGDLPTSRPRPSISNHYISPIAFQHMNYALPGKCCPVNLPASNGDGHATGDLLIQATLQETDMQPEAEPRPTTTTTKCVNQALLPLPDRVKAEQCRGLPGIGEDASLSSTVDETCQAGVSPMPYFSDGDTSYLAEGSPAATIGESDAVQATPRPQRPESMSPSFADVGYLMQEDQSEPSQSTPLEASDSASPASARQVRPASGRRPHSAGAVRPSPFLAPGIAISGKAGPAPQARSAAATRRSSLGATFCAGPAANLRRRPATAGTTRT
eukprot:TRINITY_DN13205_c0_g1_i1.p1 TRINITY_DN13205_c0_g1~~TRINITY_DN13205_c0_g1_i1.p1  ORF type:complete len:973 (-),score=162.53 TRINITY_DN13205_c0_g1_i1:89-3007(-)